MLTKASVFLGTKVDNSSLVVFRMFYGFLVASESFGAILTGWVKRTLIEPEFTFSFIGFEWLQPLPGDGMIYYFIVMGICGLMVMLGLFYRVSTILFFLLWTAVYLMQKSEYNNHYYLLVLMSAVMTIMPAHKSKSLDVKFGITKESNTCPNACIWFFIIQIWIVYSFASFNKIHADWLFARPISIWFQYKADYWLIGPLLAKEWFQYTISWGGVIYDGTIVFLLLYKPTRKLGFGLSLFFNLFNSVVFQIGIFPYMMIALTTFFFPPKTIRSIFFREKKEITVQPQKLSYPLMWLFVGYFLIQLGLPIRHHFYFGDVHWTEEGHRMAWQMMLRTKTGHVDFEVVDKASREKTKIDELQYMTARQKHVLAGHPDMIWTFAQRLKEEFLNEGKEVSVYAISKISLNGHPARLLIDPSVDLGSVSWEKWKHSAWISNSDSDDRFEK